MNLSVPRTAPQAVDNVVLLATADELRERLRRENNRKSKLKGRTRPTKGRILLSEIEVRLWQEIGESRGR